MRVARGGGNDGNINQIKALPHCETENIIGWLSYPMLMFVCLFVCLFICLFVCLLFVVCCLLFVVCYLFAILPFWIVY